jgi:transposase
MTRSLLCEAANALITGVQRWSWLKHWGVEIAGRCGQMRARIAVARRLAVIMNRMWIDGTTFLWTKNVTAEMSVANG